MMVLFNVRGACNPQKFKGNYAELTEIELIYLSKFMCLVHNFKLVLDWNNSKYKTVVL